MQRHARGMPLCLVRSLSQLSAPPPALLSRLSIISSLTDVIARDTLVSPRMYTVLAPLRLQRIGYQSFLSILPLTYPSPLFLLFFYHHLISPSHFLTLHPLSSPLLRRLPAPPPILSIRPRCAALCRARFTSLLSGADRLQISHTFVSSIVESDYLLLRSTRGPRFVLQSGEQTGHYSAIYVFLIRHMVPSADRNLADVVVEESISIRAHVRDQGDHVAARRLVDLLLVILVLDQLPHRARREIHLLICAVNILLFTSYLPHNPLSFTFTNLSPLYHRCPTCSPLTESLARCVRQTRHTRSERERQPEVIGGRGLGR